MCSEQRPISTIGMTYVISRMSTLYLQITTGKLFNATPMCTFMSSQQVNTLQIKSTAKSWRTDCFSTGDFDQFLTE